MSFVDAWYRWTSRTSRPANSDEYTEDHDSPILVELGVVRQVVLGNSSSGSGDANTQYYW
jgi:hypothetical protein